MKWLYFHLNPQAKPDQWVKCWNYEASDPRLATPADGLHRDVLVLPMTDWHARIQRAQHFSTALAAQGHRCFYLNPNLGREFPQPVQIGPNRDVRKLQERVWEWHAGLKSEPVFHHRMLTGDEAEGLAAILIGLLRDFQTKKLAVLCQFPIWQPVIAVMKRQFPESLKVLYDCHDLLGGFSRIASEIIDSENELFIEADVVVFSAKSLLEQKLVEMPWLSEKSHLVRNAVDVTHFQQIPGGRKKVVGYAGSLDEWFDAEAVRRAAEQHPDCQFVLLGRIEDKRILELESLPNVKFFGEIPYSRLPVYMAEFDVGLIPFLVTPLTLATNPIKLYEYFSCGIPVVSSRLPEVEQFGGLAYFAATPEEFAQQVSAALGETDEQLRVRRREIAKRESWEARAAALSSLMDPRE